MTQEGFVIFDTQASPLGTQSQLVGKIPDPSESPEVMNIGNRIRNRSLHLRLTEKEWNHLQIQCKKCNLKPQAYILKLLNDIRPQESPPIEYLEILKNLREINVNMNQIALKANASGIIDTKAYWESISIFQQVYSLLSKKNLPLKIEGRGAEQIIHKADYR